MDFICFDTEDNSAELMQAGKSGFDKKVTQIAAITAEGKRYYNRGNVPHFLQWLKRQKESRVYSLNIQYDLGNLFAKNLDCLDQTLVGGRVIKSVWGNKTFVDVFNLWPMSVKKLGKAFGLEKLETGSMSSDKDYVFRDVEIIRQAMIFTANSCEQLGIGYLPTTLGGLGIKIWQKMGGKNCHDGNQLSRQAYFGGRVELFKAESEHSVCWTDINSLYPSAMLGDFPGIMTDTGRRLKKFGIAEVTMRIPETDLAPLPYRNDKGKILYPFGTIKGVWTIAEINYAVSLGCKILKVWQAIGTNESMSPYAQYVTTLYQARLNAKTDAEQLFYKLLMNTLYGRLGTSGEIGRTVWQNEKNKNDGVPFGEKVLVTYKMPLSEETNWSHAAYVTSYGRIALHGFMRSIGAENLIYTDTDSTIFDLPNPNRQRLRKLIPFEVGDKLGQMKLVDFGVYARPTAPKLYHVQGHNFQEWKAKGVPKRLAQTFIETGKAEFELPYKMREAIRFFDRGNARRLSVWRKVEKIRREEYDRKRLIGNRFFPCKLNRP